MDCGADIIGLQEVSSLHLNGGSLNWFDTLNGEGGLTSAGYTCVTGEDIYGGTNKEKTMYNPIYFKSSKYTLIANDTLWFTDEDHRESASTIPGADTYKALNYVVLEDKTTGARFLYVNLHLIVRGQDNYVQDSTGADTEHLIQELQVIYLRQILEELEKTYGLPTFIGGDFNNSASRINTWFTSSVLNADGSINSEGKPVESVRITRSNPYAEHVLTSCSTTTEDFVNLGDYNETSKWGAIDLWFVSNFEGLMHCYEIVDNKTTTSSGVKYPSDHLPARFVVTLYSTK